jgi:hypothetical protein
VPSQTVAKAHVCSSRLKVAAVFCGFTCGCSFASALPSILAVIVRFTEAGTNAFMIRFSRPGMILERFRQSAVVSCSVAAGRSKSNKPSQRRSFHLNGCV